MAKKGGGIFDAFKGLTQKKGSKDKEIEKYEKILSEQPDDRNALNALGDLYAKNGDADKACEYYLRVGALYAKDGFTLKAIAVYKKAQRAKPEIINTYLLLADLYVQKGLIGEAKTNYLTAADMQAAAGAKHDSLDTYRKIADLDPKNVNIRSKLAAMYEKENFMEDAAIIYTEIGDIMMPEDRESGKNYYHRALEIQPDNQDILSRIAYAYADHQMRQEAVAMFEKLLEVDPGNIDYREQLDVLSTESKPQVVPTTIEEATISFSEDELSSLNLGETETDNLVEMDLTGGDKSAPEEHTIDFPFSETPQEEASEVGFTGPEPQEQAGEEHSLDFQIEEQGSISWESQEAPQAAPPSSDSEEHIIAFSVDETASEEQQTIPATPSESSYFDLASRLETAVKLGHEYDETKTEPVQLKVATPEKIAASEISDIIKEFKQGVMEEVGAEDYETHYELGISYKEMELYDDAIEELQLASLAPSKFVDCQSVIGLCYLEQDEYDKAIQAFQEARAKVKPKGEQYQDLTFQIGNTYETLGDEAKAAQVYQELFQINSNYRDIKQKLNKLLGG